jgi:tetratricopeptide (TPR) repeat protein
VVLLAVGSGAVLGDELTDRARALLEQRRASEAYALLIPHESTRAGEVEYDYLLAIAANDTGEHERAVFALERVLALDPRNHLARAEIARAYLALGERDAARREFETVRSQSIPEQAKASIERLLAAIRATLG